MIKIFVIEDTQYCRKEFEFMANGQNSMGESGVKNSVSFAENGTEAFNMLKSFTPENKPDIILTDNKFDLGIEFGEIAVQDNKYQRFLNKGQGLAIAKIITDGEIFPVLKDTPVLMWTLGKTEEVQLLAREAGIKEVINRKSAMMVLDKIVGIFNQRKTGFEI